MDEVVKEAWLEGLRSEVVGFGIEVDECDGFVGMSSCSKFISNYNGGDMKSNDRSFTSLSDNI